MTTHCSGRIPHADPATVYRLQDNPPCPICGAPVPLEMANTDELGRAIHEPCYLLKVRLHDGTAPVGFPGK